MTKNALGTGEGDDVVDSEEIFGVVEFFDDFKFVFDAFADVGGDLRRKGERRGTWHPPRRIFDSTLGTRGRRRGKGVKGQRGREWRRRDLRFEI